MTLRSIDTDTQHFSNVQHITTHAAVAIAQRCVGLCHENGMAVAATVIDRSGGVLAAVRSNGAGVATLDGSRRKAYTAINMGMSSGAVERLMHDDISLRALGDIEQFLPLQGGVLITVNDRTIGAVGVAGASGAIDEATALEAIREWFAEHRQ